MIELAKGNVKLMIEEPSEGYIGSRFDWMGKIIQFWWQDKPFCSQESLAMPLESMGRGFYNEFGIAEPVGYNECKVGGSFPKIGVGLLLKEDDLPYDFSRTYSIDSFKINWQKSADSISFYCQNKAPDSAFNLEKKISLTENGFVIDYFLENVGCAKMATTEYVHNFLAPSGGVISSDTLLAFADEVNRKSFSTGLNARFLKIQNRNELVFSAVGDEDIFFDQLISTTVKGEAWELYKRKEKLSLSETVDFVPLKINLWGRSHVISPEVFKTIDLKMGQSDRWCREFKVKKL